MQTQPQFWLLGVITKKKLREPCFFLLGNYQHVKIQTFATFYKFRVALKKKLNYSYCSSQLMIPLWNHSHCK